MGGATLITYITAVTAAIEVFLLPVLFALATLFFLVGIFRYFIVPSASNEEARRYIVWGLVGLVSLFIFWGIINLILEILGIDGISAYREIDYLQMNGWRLPSDCSGGGPC